MVQNCYSDARYPSDFDCAWIASDGGGRIAAFIKAAGGPIPVAALALQDPVVEIEGQMLALPEVCDAQMVQTQGDLSSFESLARRGFYVFDWTSHYAPQNGRAEQYKRVALPSLPLKRTNLPQELFAVVFEFDGADFAKSASMTVSPE